MTLPNEGLLADLYLGTACPPGTTALIALFQGVELRWRQANKRWYAMGARNASDVLRGVIEWDGSFKKGYLTNVWLGTFNLGTYVFCGSLVPRGTHTPAILGSVILTGGSLSNMESEQHEAVMEDEGFIMFNLTFVG